MINYRLYVKIIDFGGIKPKYLSEGLERDIETGLKNEVNCNRFKVCSYVGDKMGLGNFLCSTPSGVFFLIPVENTLETHGEI